MDEVLKCITCETKFGPIGLKQPRMLRCQHTFCKVCTFELIKPYGTYCPVCNKTDHSVTSYDHDAIQVNYTIIRLLDAPRKKQENQRLLSLIFNIVRIYFINVWIWTCAEVAFTPTEHFYSRYESKFGFVWKMTRMPLAYCFEIQLSGKEVALVIWYWIFAVNVNNMRPVFRNFTLLVLYFCISPKLSAYLFD
uniref:uncharacterized protein LOC120334799 n=1 Tax=Styela clava TaxID=7725 RepID=UPI001939E63C|nr:uncharacterized protein LOC120334799 [Styela clava]